MKKILKTLSLCMLMIGLVTITGCSNETTSSDPKEFVEEFFKTVQSGKIDELEKYGTISEAFNFEGLNDAEESATEFSGAVLKTVTYKINDVQTDADKSVVNVDVTNKNLADFLADANTINSIIEETKKSVGDEKTTSDKEYLKKFFALVIEKYNAADLKTVTTKVDIILNKKDGKWIIADNAQLSNALYGNLASGINDMDSALDDVNKDESAEKTDSTNSNESENTEKEDTSK